MWPCHSPEQGDPFAVYVCLTPSQKHTDACRFAVIIYTDTIYLKWGRIAFPCWSESTQWRNVKMPGSMLPMISGSELEDECGLVGFHYRMPIFIYYWIEGACHSKAMQQHCIIGMWWVYYYHSILSIYVNNSCYSFHEFVLIITNNIIALMWASDSQQSLWSRYNTGCYSDLSYFYSQKQWDLPYFSMWG